MTYVNCLWSPRKHQTEVGMNDWQTLVECSLFLRNVGASNVAYTSDMKIVSANRTCNVRNCNDN